MRGGLTSQEVLEGKVRNDSQLVASFGLLLMNYVVASLHIAMLYGGHDQGIHVGSSRTRNSELLLKLLKNASLPI